MVPGPGLVAPEFFYVATGGNPISRNSGRLDGGTPKLLNPTCKILLWVTLPRAQTLFLTLASAFYKD